MGMACQKICRHAIANSSTSGFFDSNHDNIPSPTFFRTPSLPFLYILLCLGIIRPFLFSLLSLASSQVQQQNQIQEVACHFNRMMKYQKLHWHPLECSRRPVFRNTRSYMSWHSMLELSTGKSKEYSARGTYRSEYKKHDVTGKFNILRKSEADVAPAI